MANSPAESMVPPPLLAEGLAKLGLDGGTAAGLSLDRILSLLSKYIEEIELFNPAYGLVKVKDRGELIVKHIFDSLAPLGQIRGLLENMPSDAGAGLQGRPGIWRVTDVGSGAGLPGIPLAICMPGAEFTLIERMGRRAGFLRNVLAILDLPNVRVEESEMEKLAVDKGGGFDLAVFRAWKPLEPAILKGLFRILSPGGIIAAYKGRREAIEEEMARLLSSAEKGKGPTIGGWEALPLQVPFLEEERHLLLIRSDKQAA